QSIVVPDTNAANPYPSTITVSGLTGMLYKVTVTLNNINHDWAADLDVLLVGPNGQSVLLLSDAGAGSPVTDITLTFDDDSPLSVQENSHLINGVFKPTNFGSPDPF